jgi:hypothetical protein
MARNLQNPVKNEVLLFFKYILNSASHSGCKAGMVNNFPGPTFPLAKASHSYYHIAVAGPVGEASELFCCQPAAAGGTGP